jgi:hypothetical protein
MNNIAIVIFINFLPIQQGKIFQNTQNIMNKHEPHISIGVSPDLTPQTLLKEKCTLKICTYNIIHGGSSRMAMVMKTMKEVGINTRILTKTKVVDDTYM